MFDRETEVRIEDPGSWAGLGGGDDHQSAIDLLPPVHPGSVLLADETTLGETDPVQLGRIAFEPEQIAQFGLSFAHPQAQPMAEPALRRAVGRREPAPPEVGQARVGQSLFPIGRPVHRECGLGRNRERPAEAI